MKDHHRSFESDRRAVSASIGFVLNLSVLLVVLVLVSSAGATYMDSNKAVSVEKNLEGTGQQAANTIQTVDRLNRSSSSGEVGQTVSLPDSIGGEPYEVTVTYDDTTNQGTLTLDAYSADVTTSVNFTSRTEVSDTSFQGGEVYIVKKDGSNTITFE